MLQQIRKSPLSALVIGAASAFMLSACGDKTSANTGERSAYEVEGDFAKGDPTAPITVVEYASTMCGACANWHTTVSEDFEDKYVDTGKVRFVYRPFPTGAGTNAQIRASLKLPYCIDEDRYFDAVSTQFKTLGGYLQTYYAASPGEQGKLARERFENLAKSFGLSRQDYMACLRDDVLNEKLEASFRKAEEMGVTGTPSFFINGKKATVYTVADFATYFADNGLDGTPAPIEDETPEAETPTETDDTDAVDSETEETSDADESAGE